MSDLYKRYLANKLRPEEFDRFMEYLAESENREEIIRLIRAELETASEQTVLNQEILDQVIARVDRRLPARIGKPRPVLRSRRIWAMAASLVLLGVVITLFWKGRPDQAAPETASVTQDVADIAPGTNRAVLELEGLARIELDSLKTGVMASRKGVQYEDGSPVVTLDGRPRYAVMSTPEGGQYQITLPDGTRVWLNAASSLRYPVAFSTNLREVELQGEAYFEVMPDTERPFVVNSRKQRVHVLGTKFNVNAYVNEPDVITTLVEGRVQVSDAASSLVRTLNPGEQSVFGPQGVSVRQVDVNNYIGWKDGRFMFDRIGLPVILRQIERWYEVDFVFDNPPADVKLWGTLSRDVPLSRLLEILELNTEYEFKREGRRIRMSQ